VKKVIVNMSLLVSMIFVGCASSESQSSIEPVKNTEIVQKVKKVLDPCEISYQKCSAECKISMLNEPEWKQTACETKCKTVFVACKTKEKTIEGYKYTKEKTIEGYKYVKEKVDK